VLDCDSECGWSRVDEKCVSAALGGQTSDREKEQRLGDCPPDTAAPNLPDTEVGGGSAAPADASNDTVGGAGSDDGIEPWTMVVIAAGVLILCACCGAAWYRRKANSSTDLQFTTATSFANPAYQRSAQAPAGEDGELYTAEAALYELADQADQTTGGHKYETVDEPAQSLGRSAATANPTYEMSEPEKER